MLSVTISGNTYSLDDGAYCHFIGFDGLGSPDVTRFYTRGAMQHGSTDTGFRLGERTFSLVLEIMGETRNDLFTKRANLIHLLRATPSRVPLIFRFSLAEDRYLDAFFVGEGKMGWQDKSGFTQRANFVFYAPNPLFYDMNPGSQTVNLGGGGGSFTVPTPVPTSVGASTADVSRSIQYNGTWESHPHRIRIYGPIANCIVTNNSTGEKLDFSGVTIASGGFYDIDTRYGFQSVVDNSGVNKVGDLTDDSDLATFHLGADPEVPGGLNSIKVTGSSINDLSRVELYWNNYFLGI